VVRGNQENIEPLAAAGVRGYKCFLIDPGIDSFTMVTESDLRKLYLMLRALACRCSCTQNFPARGRGHCGTGPRPIAIVCDIF